MPATMTITLDSELLEALNRKSRRLRLDPETAVIQLIRDFVQGRLLEPIRKIASEALSVGRDGISPYFSDRLLMADQPFAEGLTVAEYLALDDEEEAALWGRWFLEADRQVGHIIAEASPDAVPPR